MSPEFVREMVKLHDQMQQGAGSVHITGTNVAITAGGVGVAYVAMAARAGIVSRPQPSAPPTRSSLT